MPSDPSSRAKVEQFRSNLGDQFAAVIQQIAVDGRGGANLYEVTGYWYQSLRHERRKAKGLDGGKPMTDEEYTRFLHALALKHLRSSPNTSVSSLQQKLEELSRTARLWKVVRQDPDPAILECFAKRLRRNPVNLATELMREVGILDALDDVPSVMFGSLRKSAIPSEDIEFLRRAGFNDDDVELLLTSAIAQSHGIAAGLAGSPSEILDEAAELVERSGFALLEPTERPEKKKRKILNGIGKILGGAVAGTGNALMATGTIVAPNPATAYGAIASGGLAVTSIFAGLGDLRGE